MLRFVLLGVLILSAAGCKRSTGARNELASPSEEAVLIGAPLRRAGWAISKTGAAGFDVELLGTANGKALWEGTHTSQGSHARFRIELDVGLSTIGDEPAGVIEKQGHGNFVAVPGSDASALLAKLKVALEATTTPTPVHRSEKLRFQFVSFGDNLSLASGGGFSTKPAANWTALKLFLGEGEQECQVFLGLNPVTKKGMFSIKDAEYGDLVLAELAKVL